MEQCCVDHGRARSAGGGGCCKARCGLDVVRWVRSVCVRVGLGFGWEMEMEMELRWELVGARGGGEDGRREMGS
jgi:hypothetical protein